MFRRMVRRQHRAQCDSANKEATRGGLATKFQGRGRDLGSNRNERRELKLSAVELVSEQRHQGEAPLERLGRRSRHDRGERMVRRDQRHGPNLDLCVQTGELIPHPSLSSPSFPPFPLPAHTHTHHHHHTEAMLQADARRWEGYAWRLWLDREVAVI